MTTVNNSTSATSVYDQINSDNANNRISKEQNQDNQMFMELLIAQLKNQDPTSPTDTNAFMQQISSMSMVEGITNLNTQMSALSNSMLTSQNALQASSMVGKNVFLDTNVAPVGQDGAADYSAFGKVRVPEDTAEVQLKVYNSGGQLVDTQKYGKATEGDFPIRWDRAVAEQTDELIDPDNPDAGYKTKLVEKFPPDEYRFVAQVQENDGTYKDVEFNVQLPVNSVTMGTGTTQMQVNTPCGSYTMSQIKEISG